MRVVAEILMLTGVALVLVGGIGLHRFADVFARMHAAGTATSLGFPLVAIGAAIRLGTGTSTAKLLLATALLVLSTPVGLHILARAAHRSGDQLDPGVLVDELADARRRRGDG